jgi:hypothetical protein
MSRESLIRKQERGFAQDYTGNESIHFYILRKSRRAAEKTGIYRHPLLAGVSSFGPKTGITIIQLPVLGSPSSSAQFWDAPIWS